MKIPAGSGGGAFGFASLWVTDRPQGLWGLTNGVLFRIDPSTNRIVATIKVGLLPGSVVADASGVWVANADAECAVYSCSQGGLHPPRKPRFPNEMSVWRVDPSTNRVVAKIAVPYAGYLASGFGSIWVSEGGNRGVVARIDERTNRIVASIRTPSFDVGNVAAGADAVWVYGADRKANSQLIRINPRTNRVLYDVHIAGDGQGAVAVGGIQVFVSQYVTTVAEGAVSEVDRRTGKPGGLGPNPVALRSTIDISLAAGRLWSVNEQGWLQAVNPITHELLGDTQIDPAIDRTGGSLGPWIAFGAGTLWVPITREGEVGIARLTPAGGVLEPAEAQEPVAGVCGTAPGTIATFDFNVDTPGPRCSRVLPTQRLQLVNRTGTTVEVQFLGIEYALAPGAVRMFPQWLGDVWQPGVHWLPTNFYAGAGGEVWLGSG